ncbi:hypothetical protein [Nocardia sp. NPDC004860]|uniref:hypothetical protein n=1 Tax=Nocardia sp. NPDC004860 TaxID=3154557 RepID=UPI0033B7CB5E
MTSRSRQAAKLARLLSERTGRSVRHVYDGPRKGRYGGWHLEWTDGPTRDTMQALAAEHVDQFPDLPPLAEFRFSRSRTTTADAVALLLWLDTDIDHVLRYDPVFWFGLAFDAVEHPDLAAEVWQQRGRTLYMLVDKAAEPTMRPGDPSPHRVVGDDLADRIRTDGWEATLEWLDQQAGPRTRHLHAVE